MGIRFFFRRRPSFAKGLLAGLAGGLAGGLAKAAAEAIYPPRIQGQPSPPVVLAERLHGRQLDSQEKQAVEPAVHFLFSLAIGAAYGATAEWFPVLTAGSGAAFALALLAGTHESALPALGLGAPPQQQTVREQTSEALTHLLFGVTLEQVRRGLRRRI